MASKLIAILLLLYQTTAMAKPSGLCSKGYRVRITSNNPTYKIKVVQNNPDIRVLKTTNSPMRAGEWQIVTANEDFSVQIVDSVEDFRVQYVTAFPGCPR